MELVEVFTQYVVEKKKYGWFINVISPLTQDEEHYFAFNTEFDESLSEQDFCKDPANVYRMIFEGDDILDYWHIKNTARKAEESQRAFREKFLQSLSEEERGL